MHKVFRERAEQGPNAVSSRWESKPKCIIVSLRSSPEEESKRGEPDGVHFKFVKFFLGKIVNQHSEPLGWRTFLTLEASSRGTECPRVPKFKCYRDSRANQTFESRTDQRLSLKC